MEQFYSQVNVRVFKLSQAPIRLYRESYLLVQLYDFDGKIPFLNRANEDLSIDTKLPMHC
jgi:hypothetical protein